MRLEYYLDLDGVFADFTKGVIDICGRHPSELKTSHLWATIHKKKDFFLTLELMEGADLLWDYFKPHNPTFLTGAPSYLPFREQKVEWVKLKFGPEYTTIVLPKKQKQAYSGHGKVLVDDTPMMIEQWIAKGGYGFLYEGDARATIAQIEELKAAMVV